MPKFIFIMLISEIFINVGCDQNEGEPFRKPAVENIELKQKLLGHWERVEFSSVHYLLNQLEFTQDSVIWRDSIASLTSPKDGEMQLLVAACPVAYRHLDQINCCTWYDLHTYMFHNTTCDDILWVCVMNGGYTEITNYRLSDGRYTIERIKSWKPIPTYLTTSYVEFSEDEQKATFFEPIDWWNYTSVTFTRTGD